MEIFKLCETSLLAKLSESELERYNTSFESMDIENSSTQKLIGDLIEKSDVPTSAKFSRMLIDTFLQGTDVYIIITLVKGSVEDKGSAVILSLFDENSLIDFMSFISENPKYVSSFRIYKCENGYTVKIRNDEIDNFNLKRVFSEFGSLTECNELECAHLDEFFTPVIERTIR